MHSSVMPPRRVRIGDAAAFAGSTPRAIRHYHEIGLLPEPERGGDDRRRYGYEDMIRLLWIRRMADAGIALDDIRDAFSSGTASAGADSGDVIEGILERLEETLADQEAELRRQRRFLPRPPALHGTGRGGVGPGPAPGGQSQKHSRWPDVSMMSASAQNSRSARNESSIRGAQTVSSDTR
ncbi:MerR family transcriptional regulator [Actinoplanes sp. NPDC023801]|uniref:MerR family transcriptional regulator n=1 Tax=Actinoplanes sp. NPDC023801 TaxID=3154595 RepID=UPI003409FB8B